MVHYKDLHLATGIEDLHRMIQNNSNKVSLVKKPTALLNAAKKLYQKSQTEPLDQEMTYIIASRFLLVYENLLSIHNDKNYVQMILGKEAEISKNQIGDLKNDLIKRYEEAKQRKVIQPAPELIKPIDKIKSTLIFNNELFISCIDLFRALKNEDFNVLVLDARSPSDFLESHIKIDNIINIPEDNIQAGLSAHRLGITLNEDSKAIWDMRDTYDAIVLLDWDTSKSSYVASKVDKLRTAIVEWDIGRTYKEKPAVLNFGFIDWLEMYPMLCTSSSVLYTKSNRELDDLLNLESIKYPVENENDANADENLIPNVNLLEKVIEAVSEKGDKESNYDLNIQNNLLDIQTEVKEPHILIKNKIDDKDVKDTKRKLAKSTDLINNDGKAAVDDDNMNKARKALDVDRQLLLDEARQAKKPRIPTEIISKPVINRAIKPRTTSSVQSFESLLNTVKVGPVKNGLTGMVNIRNTCYMNCVIQCLRHVPQVFEYFHNDSFKSEITRKPPVLVDLFGQLVAVLWSNLYSVIKTQEFYDKFVSVKRQFSDGNHEDCIEYFSALFDILNEDMTRDITCKAIWSDSQFSWYKQHSGKLSFFISNFYQQYRVEINCLCQTASSVKYEVENVMYLPIPTKPFKLMDVIQANLCSVENIFCKKCNSDKTFTRTISYFSNVLVVALKRQLVRETVCSKNDSECHFSQRGIQLGHLRYRLIGVTLHSGSLTSGHYIAACLNPHDQRWYMFNDEQVYPVDLNNSQLRKNVYAFFYSVDAETPNYSIIGDYTQEDSNPLKL